MTCLPVLGYKIMTKDGGQVFLLMKCTRRSLQLDISSAQFYSYARCTTVQNQCKTNICWALSCFQCGLEPLKPSRGHFSTVLEGQTPPHWMRTGFCGGVCISLSSQDKQKGVRNRSHMRLLGDFRFESLNGNHKVPLWKEANSCTQTPNILVYSPRTHTRARTHMQSVLLQLPNLKREKQQELEVHQIGFKDICHWAATVSMNNSVLPEKAITVHVLN